MIVKRNYIAGEWVDGSSARPRTSIRPTCAT